MDKEEFLSSLVIKKPLRETFLFVSDPLNFPLWTGVSTVEPLIQEIKEAQNEEESTSEEVNTYKVTRSSLFSNTSFLITVTENQYPLVFAFHAEEPKGDFKYTFEDLGDETKVSLVYTPEKATKLLRDVVTKRNMDNLLLELKRYLEKH